MFVFVSGRRAGKTVACARWWLEQPQRRVVMVPNHAAKEYILSVIRRFIPPGATEYIKLLAERNIVTPGRFWDGMPASYRFRGYEIGIDDIEQVIQALLGGTVGFMTANGTPLTYNFKADFSEDEYMEGDVVDDATERTAKEIEATFASWPTEKGYRREIGLDSD